MSACAGEERVFGWSCQLNTCAISASGGTDIIDLLRTLPPSSHLCSSSSSSRSFRILHLPNITHHNRLQACCFYAPQRIRICFHQNASQTAS